QLMHVYVQKSTSTTCPRRPAAVSGSELSQPVAPSNSGRRVTPRCRARRSRRQPESRAPAASPQRGECGAQLQREELGLLPGGEVAAPLGLVEVSDVRITRLDPAARRPRDLTGERREPERDRRGR